MALPKRVLAVDVGGTKMAGGVVDEAGAVLQYRKVSAPAKPLEVADFVANGDWGEIDGVGLIVPGIYHPGRRAVWAPNLWGMDEVALPFGADVRVASDRTGYVMGETWLGAARGLQDVVFLGVGTGIGAGILSGGHVLEGAGGIAGAVGWMCLREGYRPEYAASGCWEGEAAGPAIARKCGVESAEEAADLARRGNAGAQHVWYEAAQYLGRGIANLVSTLNPEMVVLGGGLAGAADLLLEGIRVEARRWAQPLAMQSTRITVTVLGERAGLLGAARLALLGSESEK